MITTFPKPVCKSECVHVVSVSQRGRVNGLSPQEKNFKPEEWADEIGRKISVALVKGNWNQARDILEYEERRKIRCIDDVYNVPIASLRLLQRVVNYLEDVRPNTLGGLIAMSEEDLRAIPNIGETIVNQIKNLIQGVRDATVNGTIKGEIVDRFFQ